MLTQIPVLDLGECERASDDVRDLRWQWIPRAPRPASFFTLGLASYQDLSGPTEHVPTRNYYREAPLFNTLILDRFGWLLGRVKSALESFFNTTTRFDSRLALPGFHIFDYLAIPTTDVASIHFDLQYQLIDWTDYAPQPDFANPISFTLPIKLPKGGGGINEWDLTYQEMSRAIHRDLARFVGCTPKTFYPYSLGMLAIHSGHHLHQIAGVADVQPGDQRITLQGHGLRMGAETVLYW
jgi:hypothetical protein